MSERRPDRGVDGSDAQEENVHSLTRTGPLFARARLGAKVSDSASERADGADARHLRGLYTAYHADVLRAAHRVTGNLQDAEDVVQTVFLRLARGKNGSAESNAASKTPSASSMTTTPLSGVKNPGGYLQRAAVNAALDLVRARGRRPVIALDPSHAAQSGTGSSSAASLADSALRARLLEAVTSLHPRTAEIFALRYFEEFTNRQIADMLGISQSSIGVSLHRARVQLRRALTQEVGG